MSKKFKMILFSVFLIIIYLIFASLALPHTGLVWDETRYISGAKARVYSIYAFLTGAPQLKICDLVNPPEDLDNRDRCWSGRPRLLQTVSGFTWSIVYYLNGMKVDFITSVIAHRLATTIFVSLCIFFVFLFASEAFGFRVGVFSAISLIFIPRFFTHSLYTTLDAAAASMILISTYFFWKGWKNWKWGLFAGVVFGLTLSTKVNAYFFPLIVLFWVFISYRDRMFFWIKNIRKNRIRLKYVPVVIYSLIFISPIVFILSWPWLWVNPIKRFIGLLQSNAKISIPAYYLGSVSIHQSFHYVWIMTFVTLPISILLFFIIGFLKGFNSVVKNDDKNIVLILMGVLVPMIFFSLPIKTPYDGVRIFLNVFPFIAILTGIGVNTVVEFLEKRFRFKPFICIIILVIMALPFLFSFSNGMPNIVNYYNELVGGIKGAHNMGFEMDYWGESYIYLIDWLNKNAKPNATLYVPIATNIFEMYKHGDIGLIKERFYEGRHHLNATLQFLNSELFEQRGLLRDDIQLVSEENKSDYYIILNRRAIIDAKHVNGSYMYPEYRMYIEKCKPIYSIKADNVPLSMIYKTYCYK